MTVTLGTSQSELYAAEAVISQLGMRWSRIRDVRHYLDRLIGTSWFGERWPHFLACGVERRGAGSRWSTNQSLDADGPEGRATEGVVLLSDGGLTQPIVLHEFAHLLLPPGTGHRTLFAETLLTLVREEMGFCAFADLHQALRRTDSFRSIGEGVSPSTFGS